MEKDQPPEMAVFSFIDHTHCRIIFCRFGNNLLNGEYVVGLLDKIFGEKFPKIVRGYYSSGEREDEGPVIGRNPSGSYIKHGNWNFWHKAF